MSSSVENWQDDSIDILHLLKVLWRKRWWILSATILASAISYGIGLWMTPTYRASVVLVSANSDRGPMGSLGSAMGQLGGLASLAGINLGSADTELEETLAVLRSRQFLGAFIVERNLMPVLFADKWDEKENAWTVPVQEQPSAGDAYRYFAKKVMTVDRDKKTNLVTLFIDWRNRQQAAEWANELVSKINSEMRARAKEKADASVKYLQTELNSTSDIGTREAINRLIEVQVKQRMLANVSQQYAFRVVDQAVIPDLQDKVSPKKALMTIGGALFGLISSVCIVLLVYGERRTSFPEVS